MRSLQIANKGRGFDMKIKLAENFGQTVNGTIVEAVLSPDKHSALFFDITGVFWQLYDHQFEIVGETIEKKQLNFYSVRDLLGQDVKSLEFK